MSARRYDPTGAELAAALASLTEAVSRSAGSYTDRFHDAMAWTLGVVKAHLDLANSADKPADAAWNIRRARAALQARLTWRDQAANPTTDEPSGGAR